MEENSRNDLNYFMLIPESQSDDLASIRHWNNLKVAQDKFGLWVSNFEYNQIHSIQIKIIQNKQIFYSKSNKLFLLERLLPERSIPALLWTPIERAFPLKIAKLNNNYFGLNQQLIAHLKPEEFEQKSAAIILQLDELTNFIQQASKIRLSKLKWLILNNKDALIFGTPLLPLKGQVYWQDLNHLIPIGFNFDIQLYSTTLEDKLNPEKSHLVVWNEDGSYFKVDKELFTNLSISSVRKSILNITKKLV
jgi:hypothetical protein